MTTVVSYTSIPAPTDSTWTAIVTASFEADEEDTFGDWGSGVTVRLYTTQNSSTTYSDSTNLDTSGARHPYTITHEFSLTQHTLTAGIDCVLSGPHSVGFYDIKLQVIVVKR